MKKLTFLLALMMTALLYAEIPPTIGEIYARLSNDSKTMTICFDTEKSLRSDVLTSWTPDKGSVNMTDAEKEKITKVVILKNMKYARPTTLSRWFAGLINLTQITGLEYLNTKDVESMDYMFLDCQKLTVLDLGYFNTRNVEYMHCMFMNCYSLETVYLTNFRFMTPDILEDRKLTTDAMFANCTALEHIYCMYDWTKAIQSSMGMFAGCDVLAAKYGIFGWSLSDGMLAREGYYFEGDFTAPKRVYTLYNGGSTIIYYYDNNYNDLTTISLMMGKVGGYMVEFYDPETAIYDDRFEEDWDASSAEYESYHSAIRHVYIDESMKDAPLTSLQGLFFGGSYNYTTRRLRMTSITGLENLNTSIVTDMSYLFLACDLLKEVDLTSFDFSKVTNTTGMFGYCNSLTTIYCEEDLSAKTKLTDHDQMFLDCSSLKGWKGTQCDGTNNINKSYAHLDGGESNPGYFTKKEKNIYTVFDGNATLTYYYNNLYDASNPNHTLYDPESTEARWTSYYNDVQYIVLDASMDNAPLTSLATFFYGGLYGSKGQYSARLANVKSISGLEYLHTENVTDMSKMFFGLSSVPSFDLRTFTTDKVESMSLMFRDCSSITSLDISHFKTDVLWDTYGMFLNCSALTTIYCDEDWGANPTLRESTAMFNGCNALVGGKGTKYNESKVKATYAHLDGGESNPGYFTQSPKVYTVYDGVNKLTYYYDANYDDTNPNHELYDPSNATATRWTNYHDKVKTAVIDPSMQEAPLTSMNRMFCGDNSGTLYILSKMTSISGMEYLNTKDVTRMSYMFKGCQSLQSLDLSHFNTANVKYMGGMFADCQSLTKLDLRSFKTDKVVWMYEMFFNCSALTTIYCDRTWDDSPFTEDMFTGCTSLVGSKGTPYDAEKTDNTYARPDGGKSNPGYFTRSPKVYTFYDGNETLTYYYDNQYDFTNTNYELYDPENNPSALRWADYHGKIKTVEIDASMQDAPLTSMYRMFCGGYDSPSSTYYKLSNVETISGLENLDTKNVTDMRDVFFKCQAVKSLNLGSFKTDNVNKMAGMFSECEALTELDLTSFNMENVQVTERMFYKCSALKKIYCNENWSGNNKLLNPSQMFLHCTALVGGNGTVYDSEKTDKAYARPDEEGQKGYFTKKTATGMEEVSQAPKAQSQKLFRDGQLYLMHEGRMYDVRGAEVR